MDKKSILIISDYWKGIIGGVSTHTANLSSGFNKYSNYKITIIYRQGESNSDSEIHVNYKNKLLFSLICFLKLLYLRPKIINSHGPWYINLPTILYKILKPKTLIIHTHHTDPIKYLNGLRKNIYEFLLSNYDYNIFISEYLMARYSYYNIKSKKRVIYGAIDTSKAKAGNISYFKRKYHIKSHENIIAYIGNFAWDRKSQGVDLLIQSMKYITKKDHNIKLLIIGEGVYRQRSIDMVKNLKLEKNVIFTGNLNNVFTPLKISKIYVHITYQDAFSNTILEAMASKVPVIASNRTATAELIINRVTGILVENKCNKISNAILKLINSDKDRKFLTRNAYSRLEKVFNWKKIITQYLELIEEYERYN